MADAIGSFAVQICLRSLWPAAVASGIRPRFHLVTVKPQLPWVVRLPASRRLIFVVALGIVTFVLPRDYLTADWRLLLAWDVGALAYLTLAWFAVALADDDMTRVRAQLYDQSGYVIFLLVSTAASASFVTIGFIVRHIKTLDFWPRAGYLTLTIAALLLSWLLIQTLFAFHYARIYYGRETPGHKYAGGLKFPDDSEPDYLDFIYYSFVVGMTSQVSDVAVLSRHMRRITTIHSVLTFVFNIAILAMSINIIAGLL